MKKHLTLQLFLVITVALHGQSIVGEWKLTQGKYNGVTIANLTGSIDITAKQDTVNYQASFSNGTHQGYASSEYSIVGNKFKSCLTGVNLILNGLALGSNSCGKYYTSLSISLSAFQQWGGIAIGYYDPSFSVNGNIMIFTSPDGKAVLTYENENPTAAGELQEDRNSALAIYPNPVSDFTRFRIKLDKQAFVRLSIYDISGRLAEVIAEKFYPAGEYEVVWQPGFTNGFAIANGVYLCKLESDGISIARQLMIVQN